MTDPLPSVAEMIRGWIDNDNSLAVQLLDCVLYHAPDAAVENAVAERLEGWGPEPEPLDDEQLIDQLFGYTPDPVCLIAELIRDQLDGVSQQELFRELARHGIKP